VSIHIESINVLHELERTETDIEFTADNELRCLCPFHDDSNPSCCINVEKKMFFCQTCGAKGDFLTYLAKLLKTTRRTVCKDIEQRYDLKVDTTINPALVERYHNAVWEAKPLLAELYNRGVTDDLIRKYRFGFDRGRITIPITNEHGRIVNLRRYLPGAPAKEKMRNTRGRGSIRLWPLEQLKYETVVICGGEMKAIVAASLLNDRNIGAITTTGGEGSWDVDFNASVKSKIIYVLFDVDTAGEEAAEKICARLLNSTKFIGKCRLPLDKDKYPRGDVNDWIGQEKATADDFVTLFQSTEEWVPTGVDGLVLDDSLPIDTTLLKSTNADNTGKRIRLKAVVSALDVAPYVVPRTVAVVCDRNQDGCATCPVFDMPNKRKTTYCDIPPESPGILEMVGCSSGTMQSTIQNVLGVGKCKSATFQSTAYFNVEDVRLVPQLELSNRSSTQTMQPALCVSSALETNEPYSMVGRMFPHPKNQQSVLLISDAKPTQDALSQYQPTDNDIRELVATFQPSEWTLEALKEKLTEIYIDISANVTRIYERQDLHLACDLIYHTPLLLEFDGRTVKGWGELLVLGDSAQGKTETTQQLITHYGLGESVECKNATVAGLLGGLQQIGNRWFVTWGVVPTHDKRLVVLEELKGAHTEIISKLTEMRSSGIAQIPKIERRQTHARTRLIALSNPRSDQPLASYSYGVEAVKELIGGLEDIRRFDLICLVSSTDVNAARLNELQRYRPNVLHTHTAELCRKCILWAWTRTSEQVVFKPDAMDLLLDSATELCGTFSEIIPIVDRGSMRYKLARLAAGLAGRTFSVDGDNTVIRKCHVEEIVSLISRSYRASVFGYEDYSNAVFASTRLTDSEAIKTRLQQTPFPKDFVEQLLYKSEIEMRDICDILGWERLDAMELLSALVRTHALVREQRHYRKTPEFIELLKGLRDRIEDRPEHVKQEF